MWQWFLLLVIITSYTVAWQVKGHWSIASGRRGPVSSQQTLPRDLRQAIAFESRTVPVSLCSIYILSFSFTLRSKKFLGLWILLILTPMPISAIYPSSIDFQSFDQRYEITIYRKLFSVYSFFQTQPISCT